ncbi:hypothetical protein Glove_606g144 [Diversispora epigaea]|uniref:Ribosome maturation protein SDO1/SBDS N-terminal domain-containing protein n=1 Tax=Diversispora epigaea TaxID=1348612 RepID=A0A397G6W2_9GLOM|nr:hypothetical protein Glove_606g144 [Diversispora epigaea]
MSISQDTTRIIYKVPNSREEYFVFGYPETIKKWRKDKTIPIAECIEAYDIFETVAGGNEGLAGRPSKWKLENAFGTSEIEDVISIMLEAAMINETRGKGIATTDGFCGGVHK